MNVWKATNTYLRMFEAMMREKQPNAFRFSKIAWNLRARGS